MSKGTELDAAHNLRVQQVRERDARIATLESELAQLRAEVEGMRGALGQASFFIRELGPGGGDKDFTMKIINAALARKEADRGN